MRSEKMQWNLLCEQSIANVWRKRAYRTLLRKHGQVGTATSPEDLLKSLEVFRERVDYAVENSVPVPVDFKDKLADQVRQHAPFIDSDARPVIDRILQLV